MSRPQWLPDVSAGDWIAAQLHRLDGTVGQVVPAVFDAYARVLHPPQTIGGEPTTWAEVCTRTATTPHPLVQWRTITRTRTIALADGSNTEQSDWEGLPPEEGNLVGPTFATLLDVLAGATGDQRCVFALWEGWGWVDARGARWIRALPDGSTVSGEPPSAFPLRILDGPRLHLPDRSYLLFAGRLGDATGFQDPEGIWPQSPSLFWPGDRSWCVATEIDFDSTLVGGSREARRRGGRRPRAGGVAGRSRRLPELGRRHGQRLRT